MKKYTSLQPRQRIHLDNPNNTVPDLPSVNKNEA